MPGNDTVDGRKFGVEAANRTSRVAAQNALKAARSAAEVPRSAVNVAGMEDRTVGV